MCVPNFSVALQTFLPCSLSVSRASSGRAAPTVFFISLVRPSSAPVSVEFFLRSSLYGRVSVHLRSRRGHSNQPPFRSEYFTLRATLARVVGSLLFLGDMVQSFLSHAGPFPPGRTPWVPFNGPASFFGLMRRLLFGLRQRVHVRGSFSWSMLPRTGFFSALLMLS